MYGSATSKHGPWLTPATDEAAADQFIAAANAFRMQKMGMAEESRNLIFPFIFDL